MIRLLPSRHLIPALAPLLLLASCGKSSAPQAASTASGEILPGSVSDAMLDTDRSQAQPPLAPAAHSAAKKVDSNASAEASETATDVAVTNAVTPAEPEASRPKPAASAKPAVP